MTLISATERAENLRNLINENHDLTGLDKKVETYLSDAQAEGQQLRAALVLRLGDDNHDALDSLDKTGTDVTAQMQTIFATLKSGVSAARSAPATDGADNPMIPVMLGYKKALFALKTELDDAVSDLAANSDTTELALFEEELRNCLLNTAKITALSGLAELKDTGVLQKILLKLTFSLASIDIKVAFIEWAPEDVVESFWQYLAIQRRDGLQVPFFEFYEDPTKYVK